MVLFDPDHALLKKVDFVKPEKLWLAQLSRDPHVMGRIAAARALSHLCDPSAVRELYATLRDPEPLMRDAAFRALAQVAAAAAQRLAATLN